MTDRPCYCESEVIHDPSNGFEGHIAKRSLGQNFLVDPNLQKKIVDAINPAPDDEVLEIGPGRGALTQHLAGHVGRLVLVELDNDLAKGLTDEYAEDPTVTVVHQDILSVALVDVLESASRAKIIGNIPYNITTPIMFHLLERRPRPARIVLMVQREVADRIVAVPGGRTYGALAVGVQAIASVQRVLQIPRHAFRPMPDVDSTVIRIVPHKPPQVAQDQEGALRNLTRIAFSHRRKQFQKILRESLDLTTEQVEHIEKKTGFDLRGRPEIFSPEDFISLARTLKSLELL